MAIARHLGVHAASASLAFWKFWVRHSRHFSLQFGSLTDSRRIEADCAGRNVVLDCRYLPISWIFPLQVRHGAFLLNPLSSILPHSFLFVINSAECQPGHESLNINRPSSSSDQSSQLESSHLKSANNSSHPTKWPSLSTPPSTTASPRAAPPSRGAGSAATARASPSR